MLCAGLPPRLYESLKTLCCLANASEPLQAQQIASAASLPPAQTAKILQLMTWAGFVESCRGTKGGFWLIRPADGIYVTDVDDFFPHRARAHRLKRRDGLLKGLKQATARCRKAFAWITVADLAKASGCRRRKFRRGNKIVSMQQHRKPRRVRDSR
jgi:DNA-binding IscR family transcriptional regulator